MAVFRPNMVRTKGDGGAARTVASKVNFLLTALDVTSCYIMYHDIQAPRKALGGVGGSSAATRAIASAAGGGVAGKNCSKFSGYLLYSQASLGPA